MQKKKKNDLRSLPQQYVKNINSKWITELNVWAEIIELLGGKIGDLCDLGLDKDLLGATTKTLTIKKVNKLTFTKM